MERELAPRRRLTGVRSALLLSAVLLTLGCTSHESSRTPPPPAGARLGDTVRETRLEPAWIQDGIVYELFVRDFTEEGTFRAIIPRLPELQEMGVGTIWLMPIHPIGETERKGTFGSPYSIDDHYAVDPAYGTADDFRALVEAVHDRGMRVILDLVVNHTSWDNAWIDEHPDWYTRNASGDIVPPIPDWSDVADLNYDNGQLRAEIVRVMTYWVAEFGVDGYRVDTASMIPLDFWREAIPAVERIRPVFFLAEGNDPALIGAGFDMLYGWDDYHDAKRVAARAPAGPFVAMAARRLADLPAGTFLRFTTNHDETAWDAPPPVLFGSEEAARAMAVAYLLTAGVPMIYNGQELGTAENVVFFEKHRYDWDANAETRAFYRWLGTTWQASEALRFGDMRPVRHDADRDVVSYLRRSETTEVLVLAHVRDGSAEVVLPSEIAGGWRSLVDGAPVSLSAPITLGPYAYLVAERPRR